MLALVGALCACSCTELSARWNDHLVFFGAVRESDTSSTLTAFCSEASIEHAAVIAFSAPAGTRVAEEVFEEGRTEKYFSTAPEREDSFWCSSAALVYLHPAKPWICLRAVDDDPPATILAVEPRGEIASSGASSGYALELEVQHPGVLRVTLDADCLRDRFGISVDAGSRADAADHVHSVDDEDASADPDAGADEDAGGSADGGVPSIWGELTIQSTRP